MFLDLVESIALLSTGAPLLIVCLARPELLDRRPGWSATLRLEPLPVEEAGELVGATVPHEVRERIVRASGGNPLFLTEMAALAADEEDVEVPATLRALLAARLDQLGEPERRVLERGAVEGELFHRGTVQALTPEETQVTPRLAALVRRDFVRPDRAMLPHDDAYRFRHLLIRDAAYEALPKATRADLHRRFAIWLEEHGQSLVELDEILGYHLEQAAFYLAELDRPDPALAEHASARLAAAGERMRWRGDATAAHALLRRAVQLVDDPDVHLQIAFAMSHASARDAAPLLEGAARQADAADGAFARALAAQVRLWIGEGSDDEAERLGHVAVPLLEAKQDHAGLAQLWFSLANGVYNHSDRFEDVVIAAATARRHEALAGRPHHRSDGICALGLVYGPRPVPEALNYLAALDRTVEVDLMRAVLLATSDRIEEARALGRAAEERAGDAGRPEIAEIDSLVGDHEAAAERIGLWCRRLVERGLTASPATWLPWQARELCLAGRFEEAERCAAQAPEYGDTDTPTTQSLLLQVAALVAAARGQFAAAEHLARAALTHIADADSPKLQADAYCDLAGVLDAAGRRDDAVAAWTEALDRYERKGVIPLVRDVRARLIEVQTL